MLVGDCFLQGGLPRPSSHASGAWRLCHKHPRTAGGREYDSDRLWAKVRSEWKASMGHYEVRDLSYLADEALAALEEGGRPGFPVIEGRVLSVQVTPQRGTSSGIAMGVAALPEGFSTPDHTHRAEEIATVLRGSGSNQHRRHDHRGDGRVRGRHTSPCSPRDDRRPRWTDGVSLDVRARRERAALAGTGSGLIVVEGSA